jgi:hypothetical protein
MNKIERLVNGFIKNALLCFVIEVCWAPAIWVETPWVETLAIGGMLWVKLPFALETIVVPWVGVVLFKKIFVDVEVEEGEICVNDEHVLHERG